MDYPNTYKRLPQSPAADYSEIFDPALKQFGCAFRHGEPIFHDDATEARWRAARRRALDQILCAVAKSPWKENLVLRGSLLMLQWFGDAAREPGDVDWVVQPSSMRINDSWASDLFAGLRCIAWEDSGVRLDDVRVEDIWTYDRAPGRRLVYCWRAEDAPPGALQMDFVFSEELWTPPVYTTVAYLGGEAVAFWAATPELSLAWKLQWLDTDMYPQGKDLYDAVLLAENYRIPPALIQRALADRIGRLNSRQLTAQFPLEWSVDWDNFRKEYPSVQGEASDWQTRLAKALEASFQHA